MKSISLERFMHDWRLQERHHYSALMVHLYHTIEELKKRPAEQDRSVYHYFYYKRLGVRVIASTDEILDALAWMGQPEMAAQVHAAVCRFSR